MAGEKDVLGKADALLRRHGAAGTPADGASEDVPVLTELVHDAAAPHDDATAGLANAVFERVMRKYPELGLSLIYKNVGALFQTLYLVATALDLAHKEMDARRGKVLMLRRRFLDALDANAAPVVVNGPREGGVPHTLNLSFPGCQAAGPISPRAKAAASRTPASGR